MAKEPVFMKVAAAFRGDPDYTKISKRAKGFDNDPLISTKGHLYSDVERKTLLQNVLPSDKGPADPVTMDQLSSYVKAITSNISRSTADNDKILQMAPEVNQAAELVIPSIISPNDMRYGVVDVQCDLTDLGISETQAYAISELVQKHMDAEICLSDNLPEWIREALYRSGAKVLLTIPSSELDTLFNDESNFAGGTEGLDNTLSKHFLKSGSVFGVADVFNSKDTFTAAELSSLSHGLESIVSDTLKEQGKTPSEPKDGKSYNDQISAFTESILGSGALEVIDNIDVLKVDTLKRKRKKIDLTKRIKERYKNAPVLSLEDPERSKKQIDHPLYIELPTESVVPLYIPGSPGTHVGYFVALDEKGHPITSSKDDAQEILNQKVLDSAKRSPFEQMFQAYGLKELQAAMAGGRGTSAMANMYQQVVEHHIKKKLNKAGFGDVSPSGMNSIYYHLFSRYMEGRKTRLLFVPSEFITYMCYRYNEDGTGRSKLEDIKFILALRITLLISNMMAAVNDSIDRRNIEVNFANNSAMGDPLQLMEQVRREYTSKQSMGFSIDPDTVMSSLVSKGLTIKATGLPGLEGLSVSSEPGDRRSTRPDGTLADDVKNLLILGLGVPPSAMNSLSENEFSRSIATTSLFFARKISQMQKLTVSFLNDFLRGYLRYDGILQKEILDILQLDDIEESDKDEKDPKKKKKPAKGKDQGTVSLDDKEKESALEKLDQIIERITIYLPKPNIAPDKAQFENFESFVSSITNAVDSLFGDDLVAGDPEAAAALAAVRAHAKSGMLRRYLKVMGFGEDLEFPELEEMVGSEHFDVRQYIINLSKGISDMNKALQPGAPADGSSGGSGGYGY